MNEFSTAKKSAGKKLEGRIFWHQITADAFLTTFRAREVA
jgi:hypothetical protein